MNSKTQTSTFKEHQRHDRLLTSFVKIGYNSPNCSFIGRKQREMEMEEGSARVSWYERQLLIGPNHIFHRLLMEGRESIQRLRDPVHV